MSTPLFFGMFGATAVVSLAALVLSPIGEDLGTPAVTMTDARAEIDSKDTRHISAEQWGDQLRLEMQGIDDTGTDRKLTVLYGSRTFDLETETYRIHWGEEPVNVVKIIATGGAADHTADDTAVPVEFRGLYSSDGLLEGEAIAFTDAPDLVESARANRAAITGSTAPPTLQ